MLIAGILLPQKSQKECGLRFGVSSPVYKSEKQVRFAATVGTKKVNIEADLIDCDSPLLLSKESIKNADTQIKFKNDEVTMVSQKLKLKFTSSGHYAIPLMGDYSERERQRAVEIVFPE